MIMINFMRCKRKPVCVCYMIFFSVWHTWFGVCVKMIQNQIKQSQFDWFAFKYAHFMGSCQISSNAIFAICRCANTTTTAPHLGTSIYMRRKAVDGMAVAAAGDEINQKCWNQWNAHVERFLLLKHYTWTSR